MSNTFSCCLFDLHFTAVSSLRPSDSPSFSLCLLPFSFHCLPSSRLQVNILNLVQPPFPFAPFATTYIHVHFFTCTDTPHSHLLNIHIRIHPSRTTTTTLSQGTDSPIPIPHSHTSSQSSNLISFSLQHAFILSHGKLALDPLRSVRLLI